MILLEGFIKLSTPHRRIPTAYQPFLVSRIGIALIDTPVSMEYLVARDTIVNVLVEYVSNNVLECSGESVPNCVMNS